MHFDIRTLVDWRFFQLNLRTIFDAAILIFYLVCCSKNLLNRDTRPEAFFIRLFIFFFSFSINWFIIDALCNSTLLLLIFYLRFPALCILNVVRFFTLYLWFVNISDAFSTRWFTHTDLSFFDFWGFLALQILFLLLIQLWWVLIWQ